MQKKKPGDGGSITEGSDHNKTWTQSSAQGNGTLNTYSGQHQRILHLADIAYIAGDQFGKPRQNSQSGTFLFTAIHSQDEMGEDHLVRMDGMVPLLPSVCTLPPTFKALPGNLSNDTYVPTYTRCFQLSRNPMKCVSGEPGLQSQNKTSLIFHATYPERICHSPLQHQFLLGYGYRLYEKAMAHSLRITRKPCVSDMEGDPSLLNNLSHFVPKVAHPEAD